MIHLIDEHNQPQGPYTLAEVEKFYQQGSINDQTLAYAEGMADWKSLAEVVDYLENNRSKLPSAAPRAGQSAQGHQVTANTYSSTSVAGANVAIAPGGVQYAEFWQRLVAYMIDWGVIIGYQLVIAVAAGFALYLIEPSVLDAHRDPNIHPSVPAMIVILGSEGLIFLGPILYFPLMESSSKQASVGKMALGIKVVGDQGQKIGFWHALGRYLVKVFGACFTLGIGWLMPLWTEKKQALHDMAVSTYVVKK